jgi:hypothetical protein
MFLKKYSDQSLTRDNRLFMAEGSSTGEIFSILEGKTYVVGKTPRGELPLLMLEKKDVFGFVPFLDFGHEPRRASVMASPDLKVNRLDAEKLQSEYEGISMTLRNLVHDLGTSVSVTTRRACHL